MLYTPRGVTLAESAHIKRYPPRAPQDRQPDYLEKFDFHTVFSDVFVRNGRLWMIGPHFENLEAELKDSTFRWNWDDISQSVVFENFNRMSRASANVPNSPGVLQIEGPLGEWTLSVGLVQNELFSEANLLVTQQQDNRLEWIAYWAFYNARVHHIDSVVIYDNNSSLYSPERIDQILSMIPGIKNHVVVRWDTPFGPLGGPSNCWDSDYGQHVAWEHSRRLFGEKADTALMIDVDELPIHGDGLALTQVLVDSEQASLHFGRIPILQYPNRAEAQKSNTRVHSNYSLGEAKGAWLSTKYIYAPHRIKDSDQLTPHLLLGQNTAPTDESKLFAGHFDAIRIPWRTGSKAPTPEIPNRSAIRRAYKEIQTFNTIFDWLEPEWNELLQRIQPIVNTQMSPCESDFLIRPQTKI
ncbi:hypothetical protein L8V01_02815 [Corynebacterium sp. c8Ua_181]|uniref:Glycosyltransferase family 92 protein n=1 Tax=Corynebacterium curieae TaxID=2913500 RepID=A0A9X3M8Y8_9CORY|nr:hypothetical protein [Corynebacterium curieae]MCZ9306417.1 hypothetical protein [Corynebacterium curieae]MDV2424014.1 hypothetical protein [Corynebacterium curieae]